jgi:hypothetical protein
VVVLGNVVESATGADQNSVAVQWAVQILEAVAGNDMVAASALFTSLVQEQGLAQDSVQVRLLWEIINDSQTVTWQNLPTDTGIVWQIVDTSDGTSWVVISTTT